MNVVFFSLVLAALLTAVVFLLEYAVPRGLVSASRAARSKAAGAGLTILCAAWSTHYILLMLEGGMARYHNLAILLMAALAVLCFFYLDYLMTRALGGVVLLSVNAAISQAFVADLPARGAYAILCYLLGIAAMVMIGLPWRFRQLLETSATNAGWRHTAGGLLALCAVVLLGFAVVA
ncbi:MAG: hypothetical protein ACOCUY_00975 [Verrucomicrobiota bacterium]